MDWQRFREGQAVRREQARAQPLGLNHQLEDNAGWALNHSATGVSCVSPCCQGPLGAQCSGPQALVKVERPQRSEDERP